MHRFSRTELRTTDVDGARAFYDAVLGAAPRAIECLPDAAVARGARPHWLGLIAVDDPEALADAFVARGATRLGPVRPDDGRVILRDPGGAVVALSRAPATDDVAWRVLLTAGATFLHYEALFGWRRTGRVVDLAAHGRYESFAWSEGGDDVGATSDIAGRPALHPHWLFHFAVDALDHAVARVRAHGGVVVGTYDPRGPRVAVCEDPQGAAFALREEHA